MYSFWKNLLPGEQIIITILVITIIITGIALIFVLRQHNRQKRQAAWHRAMATWHQSIQDGKVIAYDSARYFSPAHLEKFAVELFRQMGYKAIHTGQSGDHGIDVRLTNPLGQIELVQCKQLNKLVGEPDIRAFEGAITHNKAVRGYFIAPGGFTEPARIYAKGTNVILVDNLEVGRMVESAFGKETVLITKNS